MAKYILTIDGEQTDFARATKSTVVDEMTKVRKGGEKRALSVVTDKGSVVAELKAVKTRLITKHTKPYTKTIELPAELAALVPEGYAAAYERPTKDAVVLRRESDEVEAFDENAAEFRYTVVQRSTCDLLGYAPTTRVAGAVMTKRERLKKSA